MLSPMIGTISLLFGAATLTSAISIPKIHSDPPHSFSTGFRLVANSSNSEADRIGLADYDSIEGWEVQGIHTGAGFNDAILTNSTGRIFYQNGTDSDLRRNHGSILTDGGTPPFPMGIYIQAKDEKDANNITEHEVSINVGTGTMGVSLESSSEPYIHLAANMPGTFVACLRTIPYYDAEFIVVRYASSIFDTAKASYVPAIPEDCTPITLIPECDDLAELPGGSIASHEFAQKSRCYGDVSAIDWAHRESVPSHVP